MNIAAFEHGQLVHGGSCCGIFSNRAGKRDENFIRVQAGVAAAEILGFRVWIGSIAWAETRSSS